MPLRPPKDLEAFVHRALRDLPERPAPATLEQRVFAALAERSRAPWWQRGWHAWPLLPRVAMLGAGTAAAIALGWLALAGGHTVAGFSPVAWAQQSAPWLLTIGSVVGTLVDAGAVFLRSVQSYLLGLVILMGAAYATAIGVGASLYRNFVLNRESTLS